MTNQTLKFDNFYCDPSGLTKGCQPLKFWGKDELLLLYEFVVAKNVMAGVKQLWLVNEAMLDLSELAKKYNIVIKSIVKVENISALPSFMLAGDKVVLEVDNLEEMNDALATEIVSICANLNLSKLVRFGQDLYSLGAIDKKFNMPPERVLEELGFLDRKCYLYGCNYIDKDALRLFEGYDVQYIFSPLDDAENGRGFLNFKLYEDKICHLATGKGQIDITSNANLLRLTTNNLLCSNQMVKIYDYGKLLPYKAQDEQEILRILDSKIVVPCENFDLLEQKVDKLLAGKREKN